MVSCSSRTRSCILHAAVNQRCVGPAMPSAATVPSTGSSLAVPPHAPLTRAQSWQSMQQVKPLAVCKVPVSGPHASWRPCPSLPQVMASNPLGRVGDSELKVFFLPEETGLVLGSRCRAYAELGTPTVHPTCCDKAAGLDRAEPARDPPRWLRAPCP